jgi:hypothetical protein
MLLFQNAESNLHSQRNPGNRMLQNVTFATHSGKCQYGCKKTIMLVYLLHQQKVEQYLRVQSCSAC